MSQSSNITWHDSEVTKSDRQQQNGHKSVVIWFTGLSGSGKSTVSVELEKLCSIRKTFLSIRRR